LERFREALRSLLTERGLSQAALARRLGLSPQAISAWLAGNVTPSHEHVSRLEDEFAIEPRGSLLELAGYSTNNDTDATVESLIRADPGLDATALDGSLRQVHDGVNDTPHHLPPAHSLVRRSRRRGESNPCTRLCRPLPNTAKRQVTGRYRPVKTRGVTTP
jgi:transcriptional regulator with XRE-family HTH domain